MEKIEEHLKNISKLKRGKYAGIEKVYDPDTTMKFDLDLSFVADTGAASVIHP